MIILLSPAKTLDFSPVTASPPVTRPDFVGHSAALIEILRHKTPQAVSELMGISDALAVLNVGRFQAWREDVDPESACPAVFAFAGDVYEGLEARHLNATAQLWLQDHLRILSGLYGLLRPLDLIQPHRLEMGIPLPNARGKNLYEYWTEILDDAVNAHLAALHTEEIVNLASNEYFSALNPKKLKARIITPVFEDYKNERYKVVSFYAKRARGKMTRFAAEHQIKAAEALKGFNEEGYAFVEAASNGDRWVFRRRLA